jgi:putative transposase
MLGREGMRVNRKCLYRLYRLENLGVRRRRRRRLASMPRQPRPMPSQANVRWSMDFTHDMLADGRRFRTLNLVDDFTRECLAIEVDTSLPGRRVVRVLEQLAESRGLPKAIVIDNGPEFAGRTLDAWAFERGVELLFIRPGKPIENAFIESFNGRFRDECLNSHWFTGLDDARHRIETWRLDYNQVRPHSALGGKTPAEFASAAVASESINLAAGLT